MQIKIYFKDTAAVYILFKNLLLHHFFLFNFCLKLLIGIIFKIIFIYHFTMIYGYLKKYNIIEPKNNIKIICLCV